MDSISQAALGAAIGHALLGEKRGKRAAILGAVCATIPDLDVILYAVYSPLEMLSIHRGFSHSILFSLIGAFAFTFLLTKWRWAEAFTKLRLWLFSWLCLITHMLLDWCTAYGTQLMLPFSNSRFSLDCINVIDPVYTLPLLIGMAISLVRKTLYPNQIGLLISSLYLLMTLGLKHTVVHEMVSNDLKMSEIEYEELKTMPVGIASLKWYGIAKTEDTLYLKKFSLLTGPIGTFAAFPINDSLLNEVDTKLVERMRWFSKGTYTVMESDSAIRFFNLQVDMRGVIDDGVQLSPTAGFFELKKNGNGKWQFNSGTVLPEHIQ